VWQFYVNSPSAVTVTFPSVTGANGCVQNPVNSFNGSTTITLVPTNGTTGVSEAFMSGAVTITQQPSGGLPTLTFTGAALPLAEPVTTAFWVFQINS